MTLWKLEVKEGRQIWRPLKEGEKQSHIDIHLLTKKSNDPNHSYENKTPIFSSTAESVKKAIQFYSSIQTEDGHWVCPNS